MRACIRLGLAMFVAAGFVGCSRSGSPKTSAHENEHPDEEAEVGVTFKAGRGLHVPETTARFIDLKTAEVEERRVPFELRFSAQVYQGGAGVRSVALEPKPGSTTKLASAEIRPEDARLLRRGLAVNVEINSAASLRGRVVEIAAHPEKSGAHDDVTVAIDDPEGRLRSGLFVNVVAPVGGEREVMTVPRRALLRTAEDEFVYTRNGEHFIRTPVKTGAANEENVEITDGLYAGDEVVVNPVMTLWMAELQSIRGGKACADGH